MIIPCFPILSVLVNKPCQEHEYTHHNKKRSLLYLNKGMPLEMESRWRETILIQSLGSLSYIVDV